MSEVDKLGLPQQPGNVAGVRSSNTRPGADSASTNPIVQPNDKFVAQAETDKSDPGTRTRAVANEVATYPGLSNAARKLLFRESNK